MEVGIRCLRSGIRRPVRLSGWFPGEDVQGSIPAGWCPYCGAEIFTPGSKMCRRCVRKEWQNYEKTFESVFELHPGR